MTVVQTTLVCIVGDEDEEFGDQPFSVTVHNYLGYSYVFTSRIMQAAPVLASVSPTSVSINGGGIVTVTGTNFAQNVADCYDYYNYGPFCAGGHGTFISCTNTSMVVHLVNAPNPQMYPREIEIGHFYWELSQPVHLIYSSPYLMTFVPPAIGTASSNTISRFGGTLTIYGNYFGTDSGFFTNVVLGANKMTGTITAITYTTMNLNFAAGSPSSWGIYENLYLNFDNGGQAVLLSAVHIT